MKLNVSIKAGKISHDLVIHVGNGSQTVKWLALTAAQLFVSNGARHGRHLPYRNDRKSLPARTRLMPKNVYTADCPFLHPDDVVNQHVNDGDTVNVDLYMPMEFDDYGSPTLSEWAFLAFRHHERHQEKREIIAEQKRQEVEIFQIEKSERARLQKIEIERPKILLMKQVMKNQFVGRELIQEVIDREWAIIKDSGVLDHMVPDPNHQSEIKDFFIRNFIELSDMYKFYSAVNSGGSTHTLEYIELCKFITETGILGEEHSNAILKVFLESHLNNTRGIGGRGPKAKPSIHSEICMTEFFVALIKITIYKKITIPKKEIARLRRAGQYASNTKATMPIVPVALDMIYNDHIVPVINKLPAGSQMRDAIASDNVLLLLHDNLDNLSKAFELFVTGEDDFVKDGINEDNCPSGALTCKTFSEFATDAGFLGGDEVIRRFSVLNISRKNSMDGNKDAPVKVGVTQKDVRQIFAASQHDLDDNEEEHRPVTMNKNADHHQERMSFPGFLEAICRLGVLKYGSLAGEGDSESSLQKRSHYECIKVALEKACSVIR